MLESKLFFFHASRTKLTSCDQSHANDFVENYSFTGQFQLDFVPGNLRELEGAGDGGGCQEQSKNKVPRHICSFKEATI